MRQYIACLCAGILFVFSSVFSGDTCSSALISKLVQDVLDNTNIIKPKVTDIQKTVNQLLVDDGLLVAQLSQCCEELSSKLDTLNVSVSDAAVLSKLDVIDDELSQCCGELNSKLDMLNISVSDVAILSKLDMIDDELSQCCENLDSQLDVIDDEFSVHDEVVNSKLDVIDDELSQCCENLDSQLDVIDDELSVHDEIVNSKLDIIDDELSQCCENLDSQLDVIDDELSVHDEIVNSKLDIIDDELSQCCENLDSQLDVIDDELSVHDEVVNSKLDVIESKVDAIACGVTSLSSANIVGGTITLSTAGSYCLSEDVTADFSLATANISLDLNDRILTGYIVAAGDDIVIKNGTVLPPENLTNPVEGIQLTRARPTVMNVTVRCSDTAIAEGRDGIGVGSACSNTLISNCIVVAGSSTSGGDSDSGGRGLLMSSPSSVIVQDCFFQGGNGSDVSTNAAGDGGYGIDILNTTDTKMTRCSCIGGNGGDGLLLNNAASGGHGIRILGVDHAEIKECTILSTGVGGSATSASYNGGDGGEGILIGSGCTDISVHNCIIRNTGAGGSGGAGGAAGAAGKAIDDDVVAGAIESKIFSNVAHNIANAIKYDLQASGVEKGFALLSPPNSVAISVYANVFL